MSASPQSRRISHGVWFAAYLAAYSLAFLFATHFGPSSPSPFWFPDTILLCALLKSRPRDWWAFVLAALPIRFAFSASFHFPLWFVVASFGIDAVKGVVTAVVLRRVLADPVRLDTVREYLLFVLFAVILIPAVSAFAGAGIRSPLGYTYWPAWERWYWGNALSQLVITPVILVWVFDLPWRGWKFDAQRTAEAAALLVGLLVTGYLAANTGGSGAYYSGSRFYAPVPFLFWAAIRFGLPGASGATATLTFFVVGAAIAGRGPFAGHGAEDPAPALQSFLLLRAAPLYLIAILIDQTHAAEQSLRESEERFRRLAHSAPVLLWMTGQDKLCTFFNRGWLEFTGRTLEQELGNGWAEGVHPDDFEACVAHYYAAFDARKPFELEYRLRRYDGEYRWILDIGVPRYAPDGSFQGFIGSAIDITDRKHTEDLHRALAHTQRLALVGELTAAIAQEVREPMSAILRDAQTAEGLAVDEAISAEEVRDVAVNIRENATRVGEVIDRILGYLRKQERAVIAVDINTVVQDVLRLVAGDALRRNVQLRPVLGRNLPPVIADRAQIEQVLLNLVVNGMESMTNVAETARQLTLKTVASGSGSVEVIVSDCGTGIASDELPSLFESFDTTRKDRMGLGLSIAKSIVDAHHGRIWAENNGGAGATFHFTVPTVGEAERARAV